ncbi:MAG: hypothetical protein COT90_04035, partial [Candidatus Diapherotrites archaeon CG10_big_fil_rev_8_21_14_0_10_31_34]
MKKILLILFVFLFSSVVFAGEISCNGSERNYSAVFSDGDYCLIPVLDGKGMVKVLVDNVVFPSKGTWYFNISSFFSIMPEADPNGLFTEEKLDCGHFLTDIWKIQGDNTEYKTETKPDGTWPKSIVCDTQRGMFYNDVDLATLTISEKPTSKNLKLDIELESDDAFKEYLGLELGKTVDEIDFRKSSQQFSLFESTGLGKLISIKNGNLETGAELHLTQKLDLKNNKIIFELVNEDPEKVLCGNLEVSLLDSEGKTYGCNGLAEVKIVYNKEETEKYTESSKGIEYFFNIELKILSEEFLKEGKSTDCIEDWKCSDWSACANGQQTRTCTDKNKCGTTKDKPSERINCFESNLTQAQTQLNSLILEKYYGEIFSLSRGEWP